MPPDNSIDLLEQPDHFLTEGPRSVHTLFVLLDFALAGRVPIDKGAEGTSEHLHLLA
jgi:hypothetical protein